MTKRLGFIWILFCLVSIAVAQDSCLALIEAAIETALDSCTGLERNQLCAGSGNIEINTFGEDSPQSHTTAEIFDTATVQFVNVDTADSWDIAVMRVDGTPLDTSPSQNITVIMWGELSLENDVQPLVTIDATSNANVNVRQQPSTQAVILGSLPLGATVKVTGRLSDNSWWRIIWNAETNQVGWVFADFLNTVNEPSLLNIVEAETPLYAPMQVLKLQSSSDTPECTDAPQSGVLLQSWRPAPPASIMVNRVEIEFAATLYLQAQADATLKIYVLQGNAVIRAFDSEQFAPAGTVLQAPLNSDGLASAAPQAAEPYTLVALAYLPLDILYRRINVAEPLEADAIQAAVLAASATPTPPPTATPYRAPCDALVTASEGILRESPDRNAPIVGILNQGAGIRVEAILEDRTWYRTSNFNGYPTPWISANHARLVAHCATVPIVERD